MKTHAVLEVPLVREGSRHPGRCPSPAGACGAFRPAHALCSAGLVGAVLGVLVLCTQGDVLGRASRSHTLPILAHYFTRKHSKEGFYVMES